MTWQVFSNSLDSSAEQNKTAGDLKEDPPVSDSDMSGANRLSDRVSEITPVIKSQKNKVVGILVKSQY